MKLQFQDVSYAYKASKAIDSFSFGFQPGIYGLLGPNGAGKSTLIKLMTCLLKPNTGEIFWNDAAIGSMKAKYQSILGYMPQEQTLYKHFTGRQFLDYIAILKGLKSQTAKQQIINLLQRVELETVADIPIENYSGGMKQRLLLAQALLGDPKIIILDEPTVGLDPRQRILFRNLITEISLERIILIATHIVPDVEMMADEILFLKKGKLILSGKPKILLSQIPTFVYSLIIPPANLEPLSHCELISSVSRTAEGLYVRLIRDSVSNAVDSMTAEKATLEELYLYLFREEQK